MLFVDFYSLNRVGVQCDFGMHTYIFIYILQIKDYINIIELVEDSYDVRELSSKLFLDKIWIKLKFGFPTCWK